MPLYLTEREAASLVDAGDAVPIIEESFRRLAAGEVVNQPRLRLPLDGGALALMGAVDRGLGLAGVKTYSAVAGNAAFVVVLFDATDGRCVGVIEANVLGQLRTGAASAVAAKHLALAGATRLGIVGCGFQAETQAACIRASAPPLGCRRPAFPLEIHSRRCRAGSRRQVQGASPRRRSPRRCVAARGHWPR